MAVEVSGYLEAKTTRNESIKFLDSIRLNIALAGVSLKYRIYPVQSNLNGVNQHLRLDLLATCALCIFFALESNIVLANLGGYPRVTSVLERCNWDRSVLGEGPDQTASQRLNLSP